MYGNHETVKKSPNKIWTTGNPENCGAKLSRIYIHDDFSKCELVPNFSEMIIPYAECQDKRETGIRDALLPHCFVLFLSSIYGKLNQAENQSRK